MTDVTAGTSIRFGRTTLAAVLGDLIEQPVEALVVAANQRGAFGAGATGAVRLAGGPEIEREAMERAPLPLGGAIATTSGKLAERGIVVIIHAIVTERLAQPSTLETVRRATAALLQIAAARHIHALAMPAIGAGKGLSQLPVEIVADVIVEETIAHLRRGASRLDRVLFVSRDADDVAAFADAIARGRERSWMRP